MNNQKELAGFVYGHANKQIADVAQSEPEKVTEEFIRVTFSRWYDAAKVLHMTDGVPIPDENKFIEDLVDEYEAKEQFAHPRGFAYQEEAWKPWLNDRRNDIHWYYWPRYKDYLQTTKRWSPETVRSLDHDTDEILDRMADPERKDDFDKRGLVVASVQSGKESTTCCAIRRRNVSRTAS